MNINVMRNLFLGEHGEINISNNLYKFSDDGLVTLYGFLSNSSYLLSIKICGRTESQTLIRGIVFKRLNRGLNGFWLMWSLYHFDSMKSDLRVLETVLILI